MKPDNILIRDDGSAQLIDFSLAGRKTTDGDASTVGTLRYAAPEQSGMLRRPVDQRSDLYSLGVVLFECLAGVPLFAAADVADLLRMHAAAAPPDLRELVPDIAPGLAAAVRRLLAKDPDDRYQTAAELIAGLGGDPAGAKAHPAGGPAPTPLIGRSRELSQLIGRWAATQGGSGRSCVIRGVPGAGCSRLASELADRVAASGVPVLWVAGARDQSVPLAPLRTAFEAHLR